MSWLLNSFAEKGISNVIKLCQACNACDTSTDNNTAVFMQVF